ncbi:hypothetical protein LRP52_43955 [Photobacterium sp. ZSDE20]|uniref:Uncharacterized protein n=1 Tax=Photobacterium pectinilyticum TaxID=2906793 RepID=A0ABT1NB25_9GAMM|nr:hypothetical protein [Photobacterium sp. ZSDE20]MCQ1061034.1 hypothetical protein [Photobacterium sp. ZSDE20]MDD1829126.1 hypothetical protein [Photobacterium sp. ZSDE20]
MTKIDNTPIECIQERVQNKNYSIRYQSIIKNSPEDGVVCDRHKVVLVSFNDCKYKAKLRVNDIIRVAYVEPDELSSYCPDSKREYVMKKIDSKSSFNELLICFRIAMLGNCARIDPEAWDCFSSSPFSRVQSESDLFKLYLNNPLELDNAKKILSDALDKQLTENKFYMNLSLSQSRTLLDSNKFRCSIVHRYLTVLLINTTYDLWQRLGFSANFVSENKNAIIEGQIKYLRFNVSYNWDHRSYKIPETFYNTVIEHSQMIQSFVPMEQFIPNRGELMNYHIFLPIIYIAQYLNTGVNDHNVNALVKNIITKKPLRDPVRFWPDKTSKQLKEQEDYDESGKDLLEFETHHKWPWAEGGPSLLSNLDHIPKDVHQEKM